MLVAYVIALILMLLFYAMLIAFFAVGFRRVRRNVSPAQRKAPPDKATPFVSVIVPARNEASNVAACLHAILGNDYPADCFEVIVVDDGSTDATGTIVRRIQNQYVVASQPKKEIPTLTLLATDVSPSSGSKHEALALGIAHARGELLMTTDADCIVGSKWIRTMASTFEPDTAFVAGPVRYRPGKTLFGHFQALEFLALVATGAGGMGMNRPNMCNSANVAYRRSVYEAYAHLRSLKGAPPGADEVWAQRLAAQTSWRVCFCASPDALVETDPLLGWKAFWAQRRRWAGTGPRYPHSGLVATILGVYLFYVLLLAGLFAAWFVPPLRLLLFSVLVSKMLIEATLVFPACVHFGQRWLFRYFVPEQLLQIPYVVLIGAAAATGHTYWKGRKVFHD